MGMTRFLAGLALLGFGTTTLADGQGVLVQKAGNRLVIGFDDDTPGGQAIGARAFGDLLPSTGITIDPSFLSVSAAPSGSEPLPVGQSLHWDFLPITAEGASSNLMYWDGAGDISLTPSNDASLTLYDPNFNAAVVDGAASAVPGLRLGTTTSSALSLHAHRNWYLQGVGGNDAPDGIYFAALRLRMDGLLPSEPLFVAMGTFGTTPTMLNDQAILWLADHADDLILRGDYDFNGTVDNDDYTLWASQYGATAPQPVNLGEADGNGDGLINAADYTIWRDATPETQASVRVPEPTGVVIIVSLLALFSSQRSGRAIRN